MGSSATTTAAATMSSRRQPLRQARTNPSRVAASTRPRDTPEERPKAAPGFFPGITHFTDAITALPKEMIRHSTMLKEVDAKIYGPEEQLKRLLATIPLSTPSQDDPADRTRREHFLAARITMNEMLGSLDEKSHVLSTANEALDKLLGRCESAWPLMQQEIREEALYGNPHHWAYTDRSTEKKPTANPERTTRRGDIASANAAAAVAAAEVEATVLRGGKGHRRGLQAAAGHDSDVDTQKKPAQSHKRKPQDITSAPNTMGLGISSTNQTNKRRKVEKPLPIAANGGAPMEKSLSGVFGSKGNVPASPRETSVADTGRKKGKGASTVTNGRRRAGTVNSAAGSPMIASSPVVGTFAPPGKSANSPALGTAMVRSTSTRARQNSTQTAPATHRPPSTTSNPHVNGSAHVLADLDRATRSTHDSRNVKGEDHNADPDLRTSSRANDRTIKREESATGRPRPPSISTGPRNNGKASKTGTPIVSSFPENSRPRSGRNSTTTLNSADLPPKRSHKKKEPAPQRQRSGTKSGGHGRAKDDEDGSPQDEDDDEEPRYCYCNGISYGEMVACDMDGCKKEWFHLDCVGLSRPPGAKSTWYCDDCKPKLEMKQAQQAR